MVMFHSYVSLPEGILNGVKNNDSVTLWENYDDLMFNQKNELVTWKMMIMIYTFYDVQLFKMMVFLYGKNRWWSEVMYSMY